MTSKSPVLNKDGVLLLWGAAMRKVRVINAFIEVNYPFSERNYPFIELNWLLSEFWTTFAVPIAENVP
jgi:hypothetical protein